MTRVFPTTLWFFSTANPNPLAYRNTTVVESPAATVESDCPLPLPNVEQIHGWHWGRVQDDGRGCVLITDSFAHTHQSWKVNQRALPTKPEWFLLGDPHGFSHNVLVFATEPLCSSFLENAVTFFPRFHRPRRFP